MLPVQQRQDQTLSVVNLLVCITAAILPRQITLYMHRFLHPGHVVISLFRHTRLHMIYLSGVSTTCYSDGCMTLPINDQMTCCNVIAGSGYLGSVLDPRNGTMYFDGGALGITDVKFINGTFYAWYMGVQDATLVNATAANTLRAGVAVSHDGIHWSRCDGLAAAYGALLDVTPGVDVFIFGPHVFDFSNASALNAASLPPANSSLPLPICSQLPTVEGNFTMLYHSYAVTGRLELPQLTAQSIDLLHFNKTGPLVGVAPSSNNASFDYLAAADGRIIKAAEEYLFFYEAAAADFAYTLGLARSIDGVHFTKDISCTGVPGGPVFEPSNTSFAFDSGSIGTPFPLLQPDGELWLYYVGFGVSPVLPSANAQAMATEGQFASQIGLAISVPNAAGKQDYCNFERIPAVYSSSAVYRL